MSENLPALRENLEIQMPNLVAVQMQNGVFFVISNMTEEETGIHYSLLLLIKSPQY